MSTEEIHHTLGELRIALDREHFDHEGVNNALTSMEDKLREESFMSGDEYLVHELKEGLKHFEEEHPDITALVGRLADLMAKMGI